MEYRELGHSGIKVSTVAMGCWAIVGDATWGAQDERVAIAAIHAALDEGINLFDTAESYGDGYSEELLGRALQGRRDRAIIASKVSSGHLSRAALLAACEASLRRLRTDYIDLYQVHWPSRTVPLAETMDAMAELRAQGKIRAIGVCNFASRDMDELLALGGCATNQLPYSLLARAIEYEVQPKCVAHGIGILPYSPLAQGLLTGKFASADEVPEGRARTRHFAGTRPQARHGEAGCEAETFAAIARVREIAAGMSQPMASVSLAWLLHQPAVVSVLAGARSPQQIRENVRAAQIRLSPHVVQALSAATEEVKRCLGTNPDLWQPAAQSRMR